jgi:pimeloyl-ACP methyl ester carboxylesterase
MLKNSTFKLKGSLNKTILGDITYANELSNKIVVFVHGFKGFKDWGTHNLVAKYFAEHNINFVKFNFSHSGVKPEEPNDVTDMELFADNTPTKELFDLDVVIKHLKTNFPNADISLIGHSRGGGIAILYVNTHPEIKNLITWAAIDSFRSLWKKEQEESWKTTGKIEVFNARTKEYMPLNFILLTDIEQNEEKLNILKAAKNISIPWLIIHGNEDINVNLEVAKHFNQINTTSIFVEIEHANHVFGANHPYKENSLPTLLKQVCDKSIAFLN